MRKVSQSGNVASVFTVASTNLTSPSMSRSNTFSSMTRLGVNTADRNAPPKTPLDRTFGDFTKPTVLSNLLSTFPDGHLNAVVRSQIYKNHEDKKWHCAQCDYASGNCTDVTRHVEAKHVFTEEVSCPYCNKHCPTNNALRVHCIRK